MIATRIVHWHAGVLCGLLLAATATLARADGAVEIGAVEARRVRQLTIRPQATAPRGFTRVIALPKGKVFVVAWIQLKITPDETADANQSQKIDAKEIYLAGAQDEKLLAVGRVSRDGRFDAYPPAISYSGGPRETGLDAAFVVPEEQATFTLHIGPATHALKLSDKIDDALDPTAVAKFAIKKIEVVKEVTNPMTLGPSDQPVGEFQETLAAVADRFVAVTLEVEGRVANSSQIRNFYFMPEDLGLLYGSQVYVTPVGHLNFIGKFSPETTAFNASPNRKGGFAPMQTTFYFPLPNRISKFRLLYLMHPVADGAIPE